MLRRRGVRPHDADEAVQETAARAVSLNLEFADADDLFRWGSVVSWRIAIDARRRCTRVSDVDVPDRADVVDVAQVAEHRIVLTAVTNRFKELSERDRAVLLAGFDEQPMATRVESVRMAVARHRARSRLRSLLDGLAAPVAAFAARRWRWRTAQIEAFAASAAPALLCLVISVGPAATSSSPVIATAAPIATSSATVHPHAAAALPTAARVNGAASVTGPARTRRAAPDPPSWEIDLPATPDGKPTVAGSRPRRESDHLICVTPPALMGLTTTCADPPKH